MTLTGEELAELTAAPDAPAPLVGSSAGAATLAAIVVGMIASAVYRQGAFYPSDAFGLAVVSVPISVAALVHRRDRYAIAFFVSVIGLAGWWLIRSHMEQSVAAFLPLGASVLGFGAAFLVIRNLEHRDRSRVAIAVVAIAALSAAAGVAGVLWRWHPLAYEVTGAWRVSTTLTYPAAAAIVSIIGLLVALSLDPRAPLVRLAICVCAAGLLGTQSHWELLALAGGALVVPVRRCVDALWPVLTGGAAGLVLVATARGHRPGWTTFAAVGVLVALSMLTKPRSVAPRGHSRLRAGMLVLVVAGCAAFLVVHHPGSRSTTQPADRNEFVSWSASTQAFQSSTVTGIGPPRIYANHEPVASYPGFFPDGLLTISTEGGVVGAVLLLGAGALVAASIRRRDLLTSCATGAVIAFAISGGVDFDWQLPALALLGGCVAGIAAEAPATPRPAAAAASGRFPWGAVSLWSLVALTVVAAQLVVGATQESSGASGVDEHSSQAAPTTTPGSPGRIILNGDDPTDPFMLKIHGLYYLYASEGETFLNVPLRIGSQLGQWGQPIDVLPALPAWAGRGADWAPDVQRVQGGWALYFTALLKGADPAIHCIGDAFSSSPSGPFVAAPHPFICQLDHRGSIDARVITAPGHQLVMLWKSDDNANPRDPGPDQGGNTGIYAQYLSPDGRQLLGQPTKILGPSEPWEINIIESPDMIEAWGTYWLFFSGNWYYSPSYGIGVAACQSPLGPCTDPDPAPFLGSNLQGSGPGEESIFQDGNTVSLLYNPFHANDPGPVIPRPVAMTRIGFTPKGPFLAAP